MSDPAYLTIDELHARYADGSLTPVDVVEARLARIDAHEPLINAFTIVDADRARKAASASAARWQRKSPCGALDGVPFTAKDNLAVAGLPTRHGSLATPDTPATLNSPLIQHCLDAGAILLGITTMPEFGAGATTVSPLTGRTANPWDPSMHAGGSTGGGAAAVSAGFADFSVGSDAGGSLRIPAALTGVVGFKPTGGLVPIFPENIAAILSTFGPVARTVADAARVLDVISTPDPRDPFSCAWRDRDFAAAAATPGTLAGVRIAISPRLGFAPFVDAEILAALDRVAGRLKDVGAIVTRADPGIDDPGDIQRTLIRASYGFHLRDMPAADTQRLGPEVRALLDAAKRLSLADYLDAMRRMRELGRRLAAFHERYDLLVTPTVASAAFPIERAFPAAFDTLANPRAWTTFPSVFNLTQQPALSLPMGFNDAGLPLGVQIVAARGGDRRVLQAAAVLERSLSLRLRPPIDQRARGRRATT